MQAYYEIETDIPANHQLHIRLPDDIPAGRAKIAVIYEVAKPSDKSAESAQRLAGLGGTEPQLNLKPKNLLDFLGAGKTAGRFASAEEIDRFIAEHRENWDVE